MASRAPAQSLLRRAGFEHRLGHLLHEQRHPVGAGGDLVDQSLRQRPAARDPLDDRGCLGAAQPVERKPRDDRVTAEAVAECRAGGDQHQHARRPHPVERQLHQLQRRGIDPVRVFEDEQHRLSRREPDQLVDQRRERAVAALLGAEIDVAVACRGIDPQQVREQRRGLVQPAASRDEQRLQPVEAHCRSGRPRPMPAAKASCCRTGHSALSV